MKKVQPFSDRALDGLRGSGRTVSQELEEKIAEWLSPPYDAHTIETVRNLLAANPEEIIEAFSSTIAFGTGGIRGLMGVGTNRINRYTIRRVTQGFVDYLLTQKTSPTVFISYDSRNHSALFAMEAAQVLAGNGVRVLLTKEIRPTPFVSFGCRYLKCDAAIMITASHNPPTYNGYKVYWEDGAQVVSPHDRGIMGAVATIKRAEQVKWASIPTSLIQQVEPQVDAAYFASMQPLQNYPKRNHAKGKHLKIVYSPIYGAGIKTVPKGLQHWGFSSLSLVESQSIPDPNFPTTPFPNPENPEALSLGIEQLLREKGDLFFATDPDADRLAVVVRHREKSVRLTGNQVAAICLYFLCNTLSQKGKLSSKHACVTTIVTTKLLHAICERFQIPCFRVLTGFKYIGEVVRKWEKEKNPLEFLFGAEESLGYLYGTQVRDKDATISACLIAEIALGQKEQGKTLVDLLESIYREFGVYREKQLALSFSLGESKKIEKQLARLRQDPPDAIGTAEIVGMRDYLTRKEKIKGEERERELTLPQSNVIAFSLADGSEYIIRPSGTEPKVKLYGMGVDQRARDPHMDIPTLIEECDRKVEYGLSHLEESYFS